MPEQDFGPRNGGRVVRREVPFRVFQLDEIEPFDETGGRVAGNQGHFGRREGPKAEGQGPHPWWVGELEGGRPPPPPLATGALGARSAQTPPPPRGTT